MEALVDRFLARVAERRDLAFTVQLRRGDEVAGMTRYLDIDRENRNVGIGGTWYAPRLWGTSVNPECKALLLAHAFDVEGCVRVQFKTDRENVHSQRAIERLGARREGVLRRHLRRPDGSYRDSVYYSILDEEWPGVRRRIDGLLRAAPIPA